MMEEKKKRPSVRTVKFASFQGSFIPKHGINRAGATTFMYRFPRGLGVTQSESMGDTKPGSADVRHSTPAIGSPAAGRIRREGAWAGGPLGAVEIELPRSALVSPYASLPQQAFR